MKIRDDYHKFGAILDLIQQLCKPMSGMTYEEIMSFMGCSRKTAERTIKFLGERFDDALVVSTMGFGRLRRKAPRIKVLPHLEKLQCPAATLLQFYSKICSFLLNIVV